MPSAVTVLCPNGRRTVVKITPNTSILQIIEDACQKHGFNPDQYDLKHLRRVLDVSSSVRYAGLPNNCQLELIEANVPRTASNVTVNIATDDGGRLVHDFLATSTLWDILKHHEESGQAGRLIPSPEDGHEPVIVYTMRRISGQDLRTTTLKSLGLTSGKCMLRHSLQSASSNTQAHVATPLTRPKVQQQEGRREQNVAQVSQRVEEVPQEPQPGPSQPELLQHSLPASRPPSQVLPQSGAITQQQQQQQQHIDLVPSKGPDLVSSSQSGVPDVVQSQNNIAQPDVVTDGSNQVDVPVPMDLIEGHDIASSSQHGEEPQPSTSEMCQNVIKFGDHEAVLFSMDDAPSTNLGNEGDDFFELTLDEVKRMYRDQQKVLKELSDAPLMTNQMREMEESAKVLSALNQYPVIQLRIYFPDNNVIQASFKPTDTIGKVSDFIRPLLADPSSDFSLLLRHPHRVLAPDLTLVAAECVPKARIYFEAVGSSSPYLNEETMSKKSSFSGATQNVVRRKNPGQNIGFSGGGYSLTAGPSQPSTSQASGECSQSKRTNVNYKPTGATPKVPRWFKTGK